MPKLKKENVHYPFRRIRVYFNTIFGLMAFILSLVLLIGYTDIFTVSTYIIATFTLIILSTKLKMYLLKRMEQIQLEHEENEESGILSWKLIGMLIILGLLLLLPVITVVFINPVLWFIGFSSFVVGFSLSEILLYARTEH
ncbi:MAG: hypothetical protein QW175_01770 [Candidatus Bathyarchaeia archaeon]